MATISCLSDITVWHILSYVFRVPIPDQQTWREYIPLLGVCYQWRKMILHQMYQYVYITVGRSADGRVNSNFGLWSNIELVDSSDRRHLASRMSISLDGNVDFYKQMKMILDQYIENGAQWPAVHMLSIRYGIAKPSMRQLAELMGNHQATDDVKQCSNLGTALIRSIPCVRHLELLNHSNRHVPHTLGSVLVGEYGRHLEHLCCDNLLIPRTLGYFSSGLRLLDVDFTRVNMVYFPTVLCEKLERLCLSGLPYNFSMCHFAHCDRQMDVVFANLRVLVLRYKKPEDAGCRAEFDFNASYKVYAPKLRSLTIRNSGAGSKYSFVGRQLQRANLSGSAQSICKVLGETQRVIQKLTVTINALDKNDRRETKFYQSTNALYAQKHKQYANKLVLKDVNIVLDPQKICWPKLRNLIIHVAIGVDVFLQVLKRLEGLNEAVAYDLVCSQMDDSNGVVDGGEILGLEYVLASRTARYNAVGHEQMVRMIGYLMIQARSLRSVCTLPEFCGDVDEFRRGNVGKYPRLKSIKVYA